MILKEEKLTTGPNNWINVVIKKDVVSGAENYTVLATEFAGDPNRLFSGGEIVNRVFNNKKEAEECYLDLLEKWRS